jgi:glycosyltransferase involved in cell wall biosynthesis
MLPSCTPAPLDIQDNPSASAISHIRRPPDSDSAHRRPLLTIVIPALNEEGSIGDTIERCLAARDHICQLGHVRDIEIIVINDGSTDRTAEIAGSIAEREPSVSLINFSTNRGYGAALKEGFRNANGELVAFLDADGTCDPRYFANLCAALHDFRAAIALGSRLNKGSQMPFIRKFGNMLYAGLLGLLSGREVTDTASGMRVIRRDVLPELYPLPDGLHFTPAMSARALLNDLRIVEVPMPYAERVGRSKLRIFTDGVRFLGTIIDALLLYKPSRVFVGLATLCILIGCAWGLYPVEFYLRHRRLEEWMIYRVLLCSLLGTCAFTLLSAAAIANEVLRLLYPSRLRSFVDQLLALVLSLPGALVLIGVSVITGLMLAWPGLREYITTGHTSLHWSRAVVAVYLAQVATVAFVTVVLKRMFALWRGRLS